MPASFKLIKKYGTNLASSTVITSETAIGSKNLATAASNMSVGVPETGTAYSYELFMQLVMTNPPSNRVTGLVSWYQYLYPETGVYLYGGKGYKNTTYNPSQNKSTLAIYDMSTYGDIGDSIFIGGTASAINSALNYMVYQLRVSSVAVYTNPHNPMVIHYSYTEE